MKKENENKETQKTSMDPFYSESNVEHLLRGIEALDNGEGIERELVEEGL